MGIELERPAWHEMAACRGDGPERWTVSLGVRASQVNELKMTCRRCPAATDCLIAALCEPVYEIEYGPMRCSINGLAQWKLVRGLVAEIDPQSREDFEVLTSMILDEGIVQHLRRLARVAA